MRPALGTVNGIGRTAAQTVIFHVRGQCVRLKGEMPDYGIRGEEMP